MRKIKREKREFKIGTKNPESLDVLHTHTHTHGYFSF